MPFSEVSYSCFEGEEKMRSRCLAARWSGILYAILAAIVLIAWTVRCWNPGQAQSGLPPIHFSPKNIPFSLNSSETPERHAPETMAGGVAIFDYDGDGNLDLFFANGANIASLKKTSPAYSNRLFRNQGDGTFTDVTSRAGLEGDGFDVGVAVGDYDNDGCEDLFLSGVHRNTLYHNNCDGTFTDVTLKAGLAAPDHEYGPLWSTGAAWVDVNNDGLLDLFVSNYVSWNVDKEPPRCRFEGRPEYCHPRFYKVLPNQLFLNRGHGVFLDISARSGIRSHPGKAMAVGVADYDGDGLPDIFVTNDKELNSLFHNRGNARFEEVAAEAGVALAEQGDEISGMGLDFRDLNNDGLPDIALVALEHETFPIYRNNGDGSFTDITTKSRMSLLSSSMAGFSANIADFDNDGWKDLFVSRGDVQSPAVAKLHKVDQYNTVFRNLAGNMWQALTEEAGFAGEPPRRHRGAAVGDLNHDGKLDIAVTALSGPAEIWMNDSSNQNHWVEFSLQGTRSNRDGIGASVRIVAGGNAQYGYVSSAAGYASSSAGPIHFGLGGARSVEEVRIHWPSGTVQYLKDIGADQIVHVREPIQDQSKDQSKDRSKGQSK
jgi:enediyne biosynthesis protein E4